METVLRTLKVRLVADITDYSGPMAAAQQQAAALKAQLATMFHGLGLNAAAGAAQLTAPLNHAAQRLTSLSGQIGGAYRAIEQGAAAAQRRMIDLAQAQSRMMQDAVHTANALRQLPPHSTPDAPIGPAPTPGAPQIQGPAGAAVQAAAAAGGVRTREMFPIGDSYESQNPIWRVRQRQLEDEAYRQGLGSKAWADYQNARMAGGLKPAAWHDATRYLDDKSAAGSVAQQMQRVADEAEARARAAAPPQAAPISAVGSAASAAAARAPLVLSDPDAIDAERRARTLEARAELLESERRQHIQKRLDALDREKESRRRYESEPFIRRTRRHTDDTRPLWDEDRYREKVTFEETRDQRRARRDNERAQADLNDARSRIRALDEQIAAARKDAQASRASAERLQHAAASAAASRPAGPIIGGGGGGGVPPVPPLAAAAAAAGGAGLPAMMRQIADDAERTAGAFDRTRATWRDLVASAGGWRPAMAQALIGGGGMMSRQGNRIVQTGSRFASRYTLPAALAAGTMLDQAGDFEEAMSQVGVFAKDAGASVSQIERLSDTARELGRSTEFTATEVAGAMRDMLSAGVSLQDTFATVLPAMRRAAREGVDVVEAAQLEGLTDALREVRDLSTELEEARLGTFKGQVQELAGAYGELAIAVGKSGLIEFAGNITKSMTDLVDGLSKADPALLGTIATAGGLLAVIGPSLVVGGTLIWSIGQLATGLGVLIPLLSGPMGLAAAIGLVTGGGMLSWISGMDRINALHREFNSMQDGIKQLSAEYVTASDDRAAAIEREVAALIELSRVKLVQLETAFEEQNANSKSWLSPGFGLQTPQEIVDLTNTLNKLKQVRETLAEIEAGWSKAKVDRTTLADGMIVPAEETATFAKLLAERINYWLSKGMEPGVAAAKAHAESVSEAWKQTYIDVVGNSYVPDMVDGIGAEMDRLDEVAVAPAVRAAEKVSSAFKGLKDSVGEAMSGLADSIGGGLRSALNQLPFGNAPNSAELMRGIVREQQGKTWTGIIDKGMGGLHDWFKGLSGATKGEHGWSGGGGSWWQTAASWLSDLFGGGRAHGGSVFPGRIYEVGEFGRERFIPKVPGYIANDNQWEQLTRGGGRGRPVVNNFNFPNTDPQRFVASRAQVEAAMLRSAMRARRMG